MDADEARNFLRAYQEYRRLGTEVDNLDIDSLGDNEALGLVARIVDGANQLNEFEDQMLQAHVPADQ